MSALTDAREGLKDVVEDAGFRVSMEVPETFSPPLCWIAPRAPYRQAGRSFGRKKVSLSVVCLAAAGTNATALASVDDLASQVADAIEASDTFRLDTEEIGVPQLYTSAQGQQYLGAVVNVVCEAARA